MTTDAKPRARILLVDDEEMILRMYKAILCPSDADEDAADMLSDLEAELFGETEASAPPASYDVVLCRQGEEAVQAVEDACRDGQPFAMTILDVLMPPGIDGVAAAERIRAIDPDINIVFVTGYARVDPDEIAIRVPPEDKFFYMVKPIQAVELERLAAALTEKWRQQEPQAAA